MPDEGHRLTDEQLTALEKRIGSVYGQAAKEMQAEVDAYFQAFARRDAEQRQRLDAGEITEQQYKQWRLAQMGRGKRFAALRDKLAERMTQANEVAAAYVNDATPGIYSLNRNYAAYTIEQVAGDVGFTLWDEQTAKRLLTEQPDLMPYYPPARAIKRGIDLAYGKKQITAQVTSGILMGESIGKLADRLQRHIPEMNRTSAIRAARTAVTGAECAGRQDTYLAAEKMGLKLRKQWLATLDNRTRHAHALLDGQTVAPDKPFTVDGYKLMFPGDKSAPAYLVYNCRCTVVADLDGVDTSDAKRWAVDPETGERVLIENMTYSEWAAYKQTLPSGPNNGILFAENTQDFLSLKAYVKSKFNVDMDDSIKNLDFLSVREGVQGIEYIMDEFPQATSALKKIGTKKSGLMAAGYDGSITFNPGYFKTRDAALAAHGIGPGATNSGLHPKGNNPFGSGAHEAGHLLEKALIDKANGGESFLGLAIWNKSTFSKAVVKDACEAAKKTSDGKGKTKAKLQSEISNYARTNDGECMAEAVCDYALNGDEAATLSKEIWKILKKELG